MPATEAISTQHYFNLFEDEFTTPSGVNVVAKVMPRKSSAYEIVGRIIVDGKQHGSFRRKLSRDGSVVDHVSVYLWPEARGNQVMTTWINRCIERYKAADVQQIRVKAGDETGMYTWYKLGFTGCAPSLEARAMGYVRGKARKILASSKSEERLEFETFYQSTVARTTLCNGAFPLHVLPQHDNFDVDRLHKEDRALVGVVDRDITKDREFLTKVLACQTFGELYALDACKPVPMAGCRVRDWRTVLLSGSGNRGYLKMSLN